jgi:hypothetical protein
MRLRLSPLHERKVYRRLRTDFTLPRQRVPVSCPPPYPRRGGTIWPFQKISGTFGAAYCVGGANRRSLALRGQYRDVAKPRSTIARVVGRFKAEPPFVTLRPLVRDDGCAIFLTCKLVSDLKLRICLAKHEKWSFKRESSALVCPKGIRPTESDAPRRNVVWFSRAIVANLPSVVHVGQFG